MAFELYGIDSIAAINLVRAFEQDVGDLPKTLLFEYQNISALADYFQAHHTAALKEKWGILHENLTCCSQPELLSKPAETTENDLSGIAIIGISGRYPMADDIEELWENLLTGKDCIMSVPATRGEALLKMSPLSMRYFLIFRRVKPVLWILRSVYFWRRHGIH